MKLPLTICLHSGTSLVSRLIRWQTRSEYSHASFILPDGAHVEAREFKGVVWHPRFTAVKDERVEFFTVPATVTQVDDIAAFARDQVDKPYDYTMVARFVSRRQANRDQSGKWFCSELVYAAFQTAGINLLRACEPWEVSPGLLSKSPLLTPLNRSNFPA